MEDHTHIYKKNMNYLLMVFTKKQKEGCDRGEGI